MGFKINYSYTNKIKMSKEFDINLKDESNLRYDYFLSKIKFENQKGDKIDFLFDAIPLYDFALGMKRKVEELKLGNKTEFEFTEADSIIHFEKKGTNVVIEFDESDEKLTVTLQDFERGVNEFIESFCKDLVSFYPNSETIKFISKKFSLVI